MPFKVTDYIMFIPTSIAAAVARCTRMQRRVNRLHTGLNSEAVKNTES